MDNLKQYSSNAVNSLNQVELEVQALIKTASVLNAVKENWDSRIGELNDALERNRKLWTIIVSAMQEESCPQPKEIRINIINLGNPVCHKTGNDKCRSRS